MIPFRKIDETCRVTGLSRFYLRKGCKDGSIPCVMSGKTYMINVPALLEQLGVNPAIITDMAQYEATNSRKVLPCGKKAKQCGV